MSFRKPPLRPARQWDGPTPTPREPAPRLAERIPDGKARLSVPVPKNPPRRSKTYRQWVASLDCAHCGRAGPSQAAHADKGKGLWIKAGDDTCYPACADSPGRKGCHSLIGASGTLSQADRRALELTYAMRTGSRALAANKWPKEWDESLRLRQKGLA